MGSKPLIFGSYYLLPFYKSCLNHMQNKIVQFSLIIATNQRTNLIFGEEISHSSNKQKFELNRKK